MEPGEQFLAILPDGNTALSKCNFKLRFWDLEGCEVEREVDLPTSYRYFLALSPDGKKLFYTGGEDGSDKHQLWNLDAASTVPHEPTGLYVRSVSFSPGGRKALFGCEIMSNGPSTLLVLWDVDNGRILHSFPREKAWAAPAEFSPDGKFATSRVAPGVQRNLLVLWEVASGNPVRLLEGDQASTFSVAFTPDGTHLLSVDQEGYLRRHEVSNGKRLWTESLGLKRFRNFVYSKDRTIGLAVTGTLGRPEGMSLTLWDTVRGTKLRELSTEGR
jgi:WD40 repeat protein